MSAGDANPIELLVVPQDDDTETFEARWVSYEPLWRGDGRLCGGVPEGFRDLMPWMIARELLGRDYDLNRTLIVKLQGSDRTMVCAPLGAVAATPIVNFAAPVKYGTHLIYHRRVEE